MAIGRYKVVRSFERWEGKSLRKYPRGTILSSKDVAKLDIRGKARGSPFQTLINSGSIFRLPDDEPVREEVTVGGADI